VPPLQKFFANFMQKICTFQDAPTPPLLDPPLEEKAIDALLTESLVSQVIN